MIFVASQIARRVKPDTDVVQMIGQRIVLAPENGWMAGVCEVTVLPI
jgi:hypothetical protein